MASYCEKCPISTKIEICCSSNPDTGEVRPVRFVKSGLVVDACAQLENDGYCSIYDERPLECVSYVCEKIYERGLDSAKTY